MFEPDELQNRMKNECLPLPILYAFKNPQIKKSILKLLSNPKITEEDAERIVDLVFEMKEVKRFKKRFRNWAENALKNISSLQNKDVKLQMEILIRGTIEDI